MRISEVGRSRIIRDGKIPSFRKRLSLLVSGLGSMPMDCPICAFREIECHESDGLDKFSCPRCGKFQLLRAAKEDLPRLFSPEPRGTYQRAVLSHAIRNMQERTKWPAPNFETIKRIVEEDRLPNAAIQADNAIRWLGNDLLVPAAHSDVTPEAMTAIIGAVDKQGVNYILNGLDIERKYVHRRNWGNQQGGEHVGSVGLTMPGWQRFEELMKSTAESRTAFMAMYYGNEILKKIVNDYFRPAVTQTGFDLQRLDDRPEAGSIDNRMKSEILACRFLIADLSDENRGAYWEAGFAQGLNKPVFYTCEKTTFDRDGTHFDTDHQYTIRWRADAPELAADELKSAIRATLRSEANLSDE